MKSWNVSSVPGVGGDRTFFTPCPDRSWVHSASYKIITGAFCPGVKALERRLATLPLPSAVAVDVWTLASTSPVSWPVMGLTLQKFQYL